jgi:hypothetical protein
MDRCGVAAQEIGEAKMRTFLDILVDITEILVVVVAFTAILVLLAVAFR